jgi:hypothetical protein
MTTPKTARNRPPKYSDKTKRFSEWLFKLIDPYDCGLFCPEQGQPLPFNTSDRYNSMLAAVDGHNTGSKKFARRITKTHVQNHLEHADTLYYRSTRRGKHALLMLDIDAKGSGTTEDDAERAARYIIRRFHKGAYYEPSTGGRGRHVYIVLDRGDVPWRNFRALLKTYTASLKTILAHGRFKAKMDRVCGNFSIVTKKDGHRWIAEGDRGLMAKVPRLPFFDSLDNCVKAPVFTLSSVHRVIDIAEEIEEKQRAKKSPPPVKPQPRGGTREETYHIRTSADPVRDVSGLPRSLEDVRTDTDALNRMHYACTAYRHVYSKLPDDESTLIAFYEQQQLNTGIDEGGRRVRRARSVLKFQLKCKPDPSLYRGGYDRKKYTDLVRQHVRPEHYEGITRDRGVNEEDLSVGIYLIELNSMNSHGKRKWEGTCGTQCIIGMFKALRSLGLIGRGCNTNKATAVRKILVKAGLAVLADARWIHAGKQHGVCCKYGLGNAHPRHAEYQARREKQREEDEALRRGMTDDFRLVHYNRPVRTDGNYNGRVGGGADVHLPHGDVLDDGEYDVLDTSVVGVAALVDGDGSPESLPDHGGRLAGQFAERERADDEDRVLVKVHDPVVRASQNLRWPVEDRVVEVAGLDAAVDDGPDAGDG